ncbi:MAG: lysophospholipid acyltransferase family protein [Alcanivoracaceae bacterium]|nr:lysophospholipid acyltransferase family protein [Alcanivoracaceae bacterium]
MKVRTPIQFEDYRPPSAGRIRRMLTLQRWYFTPKLLGAENVDPSRPGLFVGNHAIFGVIDSPLFASELYSRTGVYPRSLGDHFHFDVPGWGDMLIHYGAVPGTRENCSRLMQAGQHILVFPGGAREVAKRRSEINRLTWKNRTGFARMAIEHGYDIIPFASVGCDEAYTILFDGDDFQNSRAGQWLLGHARLNSLLRGGDTFMPIVKGLGPTTLPRPEPFWFMIGKPISTSEYAGHQDDREALWDLRDKTAASIESMIEELKVKRAAQHLPGWRRRLLGR